MVEAIKATGSELHPQLMEEWAERGQELMKKFPNKIIVLSTKESSNEVLTRVYNNNNRGRTQALQQAISLGPRALHISLP